MGNPEVTLSTWSELNNEYNSITITFCQEVMHFPTFYPGEQVAQSMIKMLPASKHFAEKLLDQEVIAHYYIPDGFKTILDRTVAKVHHLSVLLADYFYKTTQPKAMIYFLSGTIHLLISHNEGTKFYNSYSYSSPADVLYFLLNTLEKNHLSPEGLPVYLGGRIHSESPILDLLEGYLDNLIFIEEEKEKVDSHMYLELKLAIL